MYDAERQTPAWRRRTGSAGDGRIMMISVVLPVYNEAESLGELFEKLEQAMQSIGADYEYIFVDDGSTDDSLETMRALFERSPHVHVISFRRNYGKSAALGCAFARARGDIIITMDTDLQDDPMEISNLVARIEAGADLVSGWKKTRHDPLSKRLPSKFFNFVTSRISGLRLHDFNCGLKAYRRDVVKSISVYGELHRFIPVLAAWEGFSVDEIEVRHFKRKYGKSKFGTSRFLNGFFDLLTVMFITRRAKNPLHFFGRIAFVLFVLGLLPQVWFLIQYLGGTGLRVRPLMLGGFVLIIVALQIISMGLVAELLTARSSRDAVYSLKEDLPARSAVQGDNRETLSP
jgi:glycosyltransferase involved in cell wall biosynthesis